MNVIKSQTSRITNLQWGHRGCMVVRFTTTWAISAYHHKSCEFAKVVVNQTTIRSRPRQTLFNILCKINEHLFPPSMTLKFKLKVENDSLMFTNTSWIDCLSLQIFCNMTCYNSISKQYPHNTTLYTRTWHWIDK